MANSLKINEKVDIAQLIRGYATSIIKVNSEMQQQLALYRANGFDPAGSDPITDLEMQPAGLTAAQVDSFMNFAEQANLFLTNQDVVKGDYSTILQQIRVAKL